MKKRKEKELKKTRIDPQFKLKAYEKKKEKCIEIFTF